MKCIKDIKTGKIKRVKDHKAYGVAPKGWEYCSKSEWKRFKKGQVKEVAEADEA